MTYIKNFDDTQLTRTNKQLILRFLSEDVQEVLELCANLKRKMYGDLCDIRCL